METVKSGEREDDTKKFKDCAIAGGQISKLGSPRKV